MHEQQDIMTVQYQSVEEIRQALIAEGIPIDRLEAPKLIEGRAVEVQSAEVLKKPFARRRF